MLHFIPLLSILFVLVHADRQQSWADKAQQGEFDFWMSHFDPMVEASTKREWFLKYKKYFFDNGGFNVEKDFYHKKVVDIGAGPRPLTYVFVGANITVIEPLGDRFLEAAKARIPAGSSNYLEIQKVEKVYSRPAEEYVEELAGSMDVVVSTNSLDHTFAPVKYLRSAKDYLKPDGFFLLVVDLHDRTEEMHPEQSLFPKIIEQAYTAGLKFVRGGCDQPAAHPALAFASCWMVLMKNNDYNHVSVMKFYRASTTSSPNVNPTPSSTSA